MKDISISIIVTIYNKEEYLEQCVRSICDQTIDNIEIILVNDGSTDHSLDIIKKIASTDSRIKIINQENKGLTEARITGFSVASGKYINWIDADDFVKPEMFERLYSIAQKESADLVYCDYEYYPHEVMTKAKWFSKYEGRKDWAFLDKNTEFWNKIFKKTLLEQVDIAQLLRKYGEYSPIVPMLEAQKIAYTEEKLYVYRVGHTSMSGGSFNGKTQHYYHGVVLTKELKQVIKDKPYEFELKDYFDYRYIYTLLLLCTVSAKNKDRDQYYFAKDELRNVGYLNNPYTGRIIKKHYGAIKAFVLTRLIPLDFSLARLITIIAFR